MKRWLLLAATLLAVPALADPWVGPGDARLRSDLELLQAHGYLQGPIDAWPLPWAQINRGLERARAENALPPHLLAALGRVGALAELAGRDSHFEVRASATNESAIVRGFDRVARNRGDASVLASHDLGPLHISWGGSWQSGGNAGRPATQHGNGFAADGSYAALEVVDNWVVYGGWVDHWWGAGQDGAMLFSTSARPMPQIGFRRMEPFSIDFPVLRLLGPVTFEAFAAQAREQRRDFDNPYIWGMRLAFQPARHFEIGFNRGLQLCGKGRPCGLKTISHALIGFGDFDNTGTANEPGNQLAGFDMSYRRPIGGQVLKLSFAVVGEDADNLLVEQFAHQLGVGLSGPVGNDGAMYDAGIEYVDTEASKLLGRLMGSEKWPGSIYSHFLYSDGWSFGRRPIGHSLDGDSRGLTFYGALTDSRNRRWNVAARRILLNLHGLDRYHISQSRERIWQLEGGVNWPTRFGDVKVTTRLQKNAPNTPARDPLLVQAELGWASRF